MNGWQDLLLSKNINIELSVHRDDTAFYFLKDSVEKISDPYIGDSYRLICEQDNPEIKTIFQLFSFPLLDWTKIDMLKHSNKKGWSAIMNQTWFCHEPIDGKACGICNPCRYTIQEKMGHRLSTTAHFRYRGRGIYDAFSFLRKVWRKGRSFYLND